MPLRAKSGIVEFGFINFAKSQLIYIFVLRCAYHLLGACRSFS